MSKVSFRMVSARYYHRRGNVVAENRVAILYGTRSEDVDLKGMI
jgi:hypothetical protein